VCAREDRAKEIRLAIGKILVIDDDRLLLEIVGDMVRRAGFQAEAVSDPREGLQRAREGGVSLVILDVVMPDLSGFDVLKVLKEDRATARIPVIMLTSKDEVGSFSEAHGLGADDYINKPFDETFLIKRIYRLLFRSRDSSRNTKTTE
jgi:DNA-binding response OmpR family regulator